MKIGDYVRTKDGYICKYTQDNNVLGIETIGNDRYFLIRKSDIFKSSPNIIDLIEEHDILKIEERKGVYTICEVEVFREPYEEYTFLGVRLDNRPIAKKLYELNIKSIVTREQFKSMGYKIDIR